MMPVEIGLNIANMPAVKRAIARLETFLDVASAPVFLTCAKWYTRETKERFDLFARGGGDWKALARSTVRGKLRYQTRLVEITKGKKKGQFRKGKESKRWGSTVIFSNKMKQTIASLYTPIHHGINIAVRPDVHASTGRIRAGALGSTSYSVGVSYAQIANWQHFGTNRIPARPLMVEPTQHLRKRMIGKFETVMQKFISAEVTASLGVVISIGESET